ncbi:IniB N-terminal domain-containing protein [Nocardia sp. alder85J]|uniref:IniB N-terminal domain-containing protein n=1 Tax=Nocardia sp. alder85J TaxID=2862949 RepID=UPI001CD68A5C|nr:IniB N-terminal domain-containing protein [Nocardia sp. alder85J]MCX4098894.1 IniB N-terminal domain-containing protein [Nocardia sp. alder85J]
MSPNAILEFILGLLRDQRAAAGYCADPAAALGAAGLAAVTPGDIAAVAPMVAESALVTGGSQLAAIVAAGGGDPVAAGALAGPGGGAGYGEFGTGGVDSGRAPVFGAGPAAVHPVVVDPGTAADGLGGDRFGGSFPVGAVAGELGGLGDLDSELTASLRDSILGGVVGSDGSGAGPGAFPAGGPSGSPAEAETVAELRNSLTAAPGQRASATFPDYGTDNGPKGIYDTGFGPRSDSVRAVGNTDAGPGNPATPNGSESSGFGWFGADSGARIELPGSAIDGQLPGVFHVIPGGSGIGAGNLLATDRSDTGAGPGLGGAAAIGFDGSGAEKLGAGPRNAPGARETARPGDGAAIAPGWTGGSGGTHIAAPLRLSDEGRRGGAAEPGVLAAGRPGGSGIAAGTGSGGSQGVAAAPGGTGIGQSAAGSPIATNVPAAVGSIGAFGGGFGGAPAPDSGPAIGLGADAAVGAQHDGDPGSAVGAHGGIELELAVGELDHLAPGASVTAPGPTSAAAYSDSLVGSGLEIGLGGTAVHADAGQAEWEGLPSGPEPGSPGHGHQLGFGPVAQPGSPGDGLGLGLGHGAQPDSPVIGGAEPDIRGLPGGAGIAAIGAWSGVDVSHAFGGGFGGLGAIDDVFDSGRAEFGVTVGGHGGTGLFTAGHFAGTGEVGDGLAH